MPRVTVSSLIDYTSHEGLTRLVREGKYKSLSEAIRIAIEKLLEDEE